MTKIASIIGDVLVVCFVIPSVAGRLWYAATSHDTGSWGDSAFWPVVLWIVSIGIYFASSIAARLFKKRAQTARHLFFLRASRALVVQCGLWFALDPFRANPSQLALIIFLSIPLVLAYASVAALIRNVGRRGS